MKDEFGFLILPSDFPAVIGASIFMFAVTASHGQPLRNRETPLPEGSARGVSLFRQP
jgi:hypothetical protein